MNMQQAIAQQDDGISLKELFARTRELLTYLVGKWYLILLAAMIGGGLGFFYAWSKPVNYVSRVSFVVEDGKGGVGGGLAAIAGQFGFDIGGGAAGGVFSGDNILLFLKSETLCRETLLTDYDSTGKQVLADRYAEVNELKDSWAKNKKIGTVNFARHKQGNLPRLEDSLMQLMITRILEKELDVTKPDKKASFIQVTTTMRDELLSKYFSERLVKIATGRFVDSKTKLKTLNVAKLQRRADSLGALLNNRTYSAAATQQGLLDINPGLKMAPVATEIITRDKTMTATIFAEVVKNLEIAKVALNQETPTIQLVDTPMLPLKIKKTSKLLYLLIFGALCGVVVVAYLLVKKQLR